jgi:hypothetical protein
MRRNEEATFFLFLLNLAKGNGGGAWSEKGENCLLFSESKIVWQIGQGHLPTMASEAFGPVVLCANLHAHRGRHIRLAGSGGRKGKN